MAVPDITIVPKMNGEGKLQRSSWKAEAIRRGDLKISGPIPITEDIPLNEEEEREYAAKHDTAGDPQPPGSDMSSQQPVPQQPPESTVDDASLKQSDPVEAQPALQETHHELRHKRSSSAIRETSEVQRQSDMQASYTSTSAFPDSSPKSTPKKKRKSGLRNVFRKMFGKKPKDESYESPVHKHGYHQSDPGMLSKSPDRSKTTAAGTQRISDIPIRELNPMNPLGQHLPFPMNVNAPQATSPPHEYLTFEPGPTLHRRRATLPSVVVADSERQPLAAIFGHAGENEESIPSPEIGVAVSSPTQPRRRSQSAGALRELAKEQESMERRRSAEIRYWRNSYRSASIYSGTTPRPRTAQTVETIDTQGTATQAESAPEIPQDIPRGILQEIPQEVPRGILQEITPESIHSRSVSTEPESVDQHDQDISLIPLSVEAFNFGNLKSEFSDDIADNEEAIGQAVGPPEPHYSLEGRVRQLEDNIHSLETSVRRISGRSNRQTIILENAPKGRRSRDRSSSSTNDRQQYTRNSSMSSGKTLSHRQEPSSPPSPVLAPLSGITELPSSDKRQTVITVEPSQIPRNPAGASVDPEKQFAAVYTILRHERAARKALEEQVIGLQNEIADLHTLINKLVSGRVAYPTPSPDAIIVSSNDERLDTPKAARQTRRPLPYESEEETTEEGNEENIPPSSHRQGYRKQKKPTVRDIGLVGYGGESVSSKEDVTSPDAEVWATPTEGNYEGFFPRSRSALDVSEKRARGEIREEEVEMF